MDALIVLLISMAILVPFAFLGKKVQIVTKFILPFDFITISVIINIILVTFVLPMFISIPSLGMWSIPAIIGYALGYTLSSRKDWMMIITTNPAEDPIPVIIRPIMPYTNKHGQLCVQDQKNIELAKRLIFDVHHTVYCNGSLNPNMARTAYKDPLFVWMKGHGVLLDFLYEDEEPQYAEVGRIHRKKVKNADGSKSYITYRKKVRCYHTEMYLPEPACSNPLERMLREEAHRKDIRELHRVTMENIELKEEVQREFIVDVAEVFIDSVVKSKPAYALHKHMKEDRGADNSDNSGYEDEEGEGEDNDAVQ